MSMRASFSWTRSAGRASRRKTERRWPQVGPERGTGAGCGYDLAPVRDPGSANARSLNPCESPCTKRQRRRGLSAASFVNRGAGRVCNRPGNSGGRIRTCDLRVMSPTSYQTALPRSRVADYTPRPGGLQPDPARAMLN